MSFNNSKIYKKNYYCRLKLIKKYHVTLLKIDEKALYVIAVKIITQDDRLAYKLHDNSMITRLQ